MARTADPGLAERRRRQIMDAAIACFRRRGFHQASMQEICAEAGLSAGAVYRYFASKHDIIAAIAEDDRRQAEAMFAPVTTGEDLITALCECARDFVTLAAETGDAPLVADVIAEALRDKALAERLVEISAPFERRLTALIKAGQASGDFDAALEPKRAMRVILGALDGLCLRANVHGDSGAVVAADVRTLLQRLLQPEARTYVAGARRIKRAAGKETVV